MKCFYYCYGRSHSSVVAAYIHLHKLPEDRIPSIEEILSIPEFDQGNPRDFGVPYFIGTDNSGNEIYIIGFGSNAGLALQTIYNIQSQQGLKTLDWHFFNALERIDILTKIGGFLSRNLKIKSGKYLAALGIRKSYHHLLELVKSARTCELKEF